VHIVSSSTRLCARIAHVTCVSECVAAFEALCAAIIISPAREPLHHVQGKQLVARLSTLDPNGPDSTRRSHS
jgi:hypothetical protein